MASNPAQQSWVTELSVMMQSVIFAAVRAPDGIRKDHPVKVLMRWYRRCVLISAFDKKAFSDPFAPGGGSFTGPFTEHHFWEILARHRPWDHARADWLGARPARKWQIFAHCRDEYLRYIDELPHHFQLHLMHAAQIVGEYHPSPNVREWWREFYLMIVNDAHLFPESKELLDLRLSDNPTEWKKREEVIAR